MPRPHPVSGSTTLTPVEVERVGIRARARGNRVEVIDWDVTAHLVIHSDRSEGLGLTLETRSDRGQGKDDRSPFRARASPEKG